MHTSSLNNWMEDPLNIGWEILCILDFGTSFFSARRLDIIYARKVGEDQKNHFKLSLQTKDSIKYTNNIKVDK